MSAIVERIHAVAKPGTVIPKPPAEADCVVKTWGRRRGAPALIYQIPNRTSPDRPHAKGVNVAEFERAYVQLRETGRLTREWFCAELPSCAFEGGCNFTTIGALFVMLGIARRAEHGAYDRV